MFQNNKVNLIISLVIAIALWIYVIGEVNPVAAQKYDSVPVQLLNTDSLKAEGLTIIDRGEAQTITVTLEGKRSDLMSIRSSDIIATANVTGCREGENYVSISVTVPSGLKVTDVRPTSLLLTLDTEISTSLPVTVAFNGSFESNTEPGDIFTSYQTVDVVGASSLVNTIVYLKAEVDASLLSETETTVAVPLIPVNASGEEVTGVALSAGTVDVTATLYAIKTVRLDLEVIGDAAPPFEVSNIAYPEKVTIKGPAELLKEIDHITAASADISGMTQSGQIPIAYQMPDGVMLAESSGDAVIRISIKGVETAAVSVDGSQIRAEGLEEGLSYYINTSALTVSATGKASVTEALSAEDFTLTVDLSGYEAGVYTVPVSVSCVEEGIEAAVNPAEVHVTIN